MPRASESGELGFVVAYGMMGTHGRQGPQRVTCRARLASFGIARSGVRTTCDDQASSYLAPVDMDGKKMRGCRLAGLFVMFKPKSPEGTDDGWLYGTIQYERRADTPQVGQSSFTSRVTGAGKIVNCMGCHTKAPHGRLFGLPAR